MRTGQAPAACGQLTPPPLTEEFTVFLNPQSNIKNFLDGTFEAVEIVVDQSCKGRTERSELVSVKGCTEKRAARKK